MFGDLKNQLNQGKKELSMRMNDAHVRCLSPSKHIEIIANGNKAIIDIKISEEIYSDKEQFEDELVITLNNALEMANELYESELKQVMKTHMPNIPGLDGLLD